MNKEVLEGKFKEVIEAQHGSLVGVKIAAKGCANICIQEQIEFLSKFWVNYLQSENLSMHEYIDSHILELKNKLKVLK